MKALLVFVLALAVSSAAEAQRMSDARTAATSTSSITGEGRAHPRVATVPPGSEEGYPRTLAMAFTGTLFAVANAVGGGYAGAGLACANASADDWCGFGGAIIGAIVGESLMLPLGVHLASRRNSYGDKLLLSAAVLVGGIMLAEPTGGASVAAIPPAQLITLIVSEHLAPPRKGDQ